MTTIRDLSEKSQWHYVSTSLNPADDASRGMTTESFLKCERWLNGPDFLKQPQHSWPKLPETALSLSDDDLEIKKIVAVLSTAADEVYDPVIKFIEHFSSWNHLKRATARMLQFKDFLKQLIKGKRDMTHTGQQTHSNRKSTEHNRKSTLTCQNLSVEDLARAEKSLLQYVQKCHFSEEISRLEKGQTPVKKGSRLCKLDPILVLGALGQRVSSSNARKTEMEPGEEEPQAGRPSLNHGRNFKQRSSPTAEDTSDGSKYEQEATSWKDPSQSCAFSWRPDLSTLFEVSYFLRIIFLF